MKFCCHILIHFLPFSATANSEDSTQFSSSAPKLISWQAGVSNLNSSLYVATAGFVTLLYNNFAWTTQKTQPLYCSEGVFTVPLRSNGSYSIVACVFVATGMWWPSLCLAMNICSDFTISAFGRHVTVQLNLGSRTPRIMNNSVYEHKASRMTYCVSSYEHASRQHRGAISWEYQRRQYS
jgi:hypothetical protein